MVAFAGMTSRSGYFIVLLITATLAAYANSFHAPFLLDDIHTIERNFGLRDLSDLKAVFTYDYAGRPFLFLTFALNFAVGDLNPFGYHVVNVALHIGVSFIVYLFILELLGREGIENRLYAALGSLVFALHPLNVETVTYLSSRSSGLCVFFYLLSFLLAVRGGRKAAYLPLSIAAFVLALMTKELAVTLPAILTLFIYQFDGFNGLKRQSRMLALFWLVIPFYFLYRLMAIGHFLEEPTEALVDRAGPVAYFLTQLDVVGLRYIPRLFVPVNLQFDAGVWVKNTLFDPAVIVGGLLLTALFAWAIINFRKRRLLSFALLWFFITLSITSSFLPILDSYVEHRLYIAMPGFCLIVSYFAYTLTEKFPGSVKAVAAFFVATLMVFGSLTFARNELFKSPRLVWEDTINKSWGKSRVYVALAYDYIKTAEYGKAEEVLRFGRTAFKDRVDMQLALCWVLGAQGKFDRMEEALLKIEPQKTGEWADYYNFKGLIEGQKGNSEEAAAYLTKSLELAPSHVDATANMAVLLNISGKKAEALEWLNEAIRKNPYEADFHYQLGTMLLASDRARAMMEYQKTLELDRYHLRAKKALQALAD